VQELMSEDALQALAQELTRLTGKHWSAMASHAVGRSSYKEMYGFVWRDDAVAYEDGAVTYLDRSDTFEREPYSARFKSLKDGTTFVVATVHILYGKSQADRASEITALSSYWAWLKDTYPGNNQIMLMGDFNTPQIRQPLRQHLRQQEFHDQGQQRSGLQLSAIPWHDPRSGS